MTRGVSSIFYLGAEIFSSGAEYLIITKERLVLSSSPYGSNESFFIRGRNAYVPEFGTPLIMSKEITTIFNSLTQKQRQQSP